MNAREFLKNGLILLCSLFVSLLLIEGILRIAPDFFSEQLCHKEYATSDIILDHKYIPNGEGKDIKQEYVINMKINAIGMRDKEFVKDDTFSILMLGDSFTAGVGVNESDTVATKLENLFLERKNRKIEVWNTGVSSYSPILEYLYLKQKGTMINPNMVILNLDLGDIRDDYNYEQKATFNDSGEIIAVNHYKTTIIKKYNLLLLENSYVFTLLSRMIIRTRQTSELDEASMGSIQTDPLFFTRFNVSENQTRQHYNRTFIYIKKIKEWCDQENVSFILVTYPYGHLVNENEWKKGRGWYNFDEEPIYSPTFFQAVAIFAEQNNITYLDTYPNFLESKEYPLYYSWDFHWTPKGSEIFTNAIFDFLDNEEFVKNLRREEIPTTEY